MGRFQRPARRTPSRWTAPATCLPRASQLACHSSRASSRPPRAAARSPHMPDRPRSPSAVRRSSTTAADFSRRSVSLLVLVAGGPGAIEAIGSDPALGYTNFCGHTWTTGNCPHPTGLPKVDSKGMPLRAHDGQRGGRPRPADRLEGPPDRDRTEDGCSIQMAADTVGAAHAGLPCRVGEYDMQTSIDGSWYRCCGGQVRRLMDCCAHTNTPHQRRRGAHRLLLQGPQGVLRDLPRHGRQMLSAAAIALALTALLAGFTGSWSPCGLSSVETIGSGLGRDPSRSTRVSSLGLFSVFCVSAARRRSAAVSWLGAKLGFGADSRGAARRRACRAFAGVADIRFSRSCHRFAIRCPSASVTVCRSRPRPRSTG